MRTDHHRDPLGQLNYPLFRQLNLAGTRLVIVGVALLLLAALAVAVVGDHLGWGNRLLAITPGLLGTAAGVGCLFAARSTLTKQQ